MKSEWYPMGALAGGLAGGLMRGGFTWYNMETADGADWLEKEIKSGVSLFALVPSTGIGMICGAIAGAFGRPLLGAVLGAVLSAGVFTLFVLPFTACLGIFGAEDELLSFSGPLLVQKGIAGALAGLLGGWIGKLSAEPSDAGSRAGDHVFEGPRPPLRDES